MSPTPIDVLIPLAEAHAPVPVRLTTAQALDAALAAAGRPAAAQAAHQAFKAAAGTVLLLWGGQGDLAQVIAGVGKGEAADLAALRALPTRLPAGDYVLASPDPTHLAPATLAWGLGSYGFGRYKPAGDAPQPRLAVAHDVDLAALHRLVDADALVRTLVDTPANDMGPAEMEALAREVAQSQGAEISVTVGEDLLQSGYPAIHAVGRAAVPARTPRLIELHWSGPGGDAAPHVVLIGKGVVFDTGGLDIKPSFGMRLMKKDMGGAAHALALGRLVMQAALPVRLTVLLPVVENAISGDAMRPGDVLATRAGVSVEVGNTDAEGRLILADALTRAAELDPALTIDLATLTGAARVALGPDIPPFYTDDDVLAAEVSQAAQAAHDPLWRMPLWAAYDAALDSDVAQVKNDADSWAQAGSITAALFLKRFAPTMGSWLHLDVYAWNPRKRPGFPVGGAAQGVFALFHLLQGRYGGQA